MGVTQNGPSGGIGISFQFALKTITALHALTVLVHCLRPCALFSFLMRIGIRELYHTQVLTKQTLSHQPFQ